MPCKENIYRLACKHSVLCSSLWPSFLQEFSNLNRCFEARRKQNPGVERLLYCQRRSFSRNPEQWDLKDAPFQKTIQGRCESVGLDPRVWQAICVPAEKSHATLFVSSFDNEDQINAAAECLRDESLRNTVLECQPLTLRIDLTKIYSFDGQVLLCIIGPTQEPHLICSPRYRAFYLLVKWGNIYSFEAVVYIQREQAAFN